MATHFSDYILESIFISDNACILIQILLKYIPKGPVDNKSALAQILAWHWTAKKPLSELMMA